MVFWLVVAISYGCAMAFVGLVPLLIFGGVTLLMRAIFPVGWDTVRDIFMFSICIYGYHRYIKYKEDTKDKYKLPKI